MTVHPRDVPPAGTEFANDYARCIQLVPDGKIAATLESEGTTTASLLEPLTEAAGDTPQASGV